MLKIIIFQLSILENVQNVLAGIFLRKTEGTENFWDAIIIQK